MSGWWLVPLAFVSMFCQDILATVLVQAEADGRAHLAAAMDTAGDVCALASLGAVGGSLLAGSDWLLSACVVAARLGADYAGSYTGVKVGNRIRARVRKAPAPAPQLHVTFGGGSGQAFTAWLRKQVRINGGGPR